MAGLGAKLFSSFTKLTAAQVNGYLMDQTIMRFATSAARDAAFGGAGEPTLAEGMTCYLDDLNVLQTYTGTAWVSVASTSGAILQIVNSAYSTATTNNTSTFADTGLTATITPTSTSSKILVMISQNGCFKTSANSENRMNVRLMRGATNIAKVSGDLFLYTNTADSNGGSTSISFMDSPATISATTYKTQFSNPHNTAAVIAQEGSAVSTITLMEISA